MSSFRGLKETCLKFDEDLHAQASTLFSAKPEETAEDVIENKLKLLSFYSSKHRLLHAKIQSVLPQVTEKVRSGADILKDHEEAIQIKIIEGAVVKATMQSVAVKNLLTTSDDLLDDELKERKRTIKSLMEKLSIAETKLRGLDTYFQECEDEHLNVRKEWDATLGELKDTLPTVAPPSTVTSGPLYSHLKTLVDKMELLRRLIANLITARTNYDWLNDPHDRIKMLEITRSPISIETFIDI